MDKTALITGASGGVALALAARLRADGWRLSLLSRDPTRVQAQPGDAVISCALDGYEGTLAALQQASAALGSAPYALAHCAGSSFIAPIARTREADWRAVMAANLDSAFFALKAWLALRLPLQQGGAAVVFSSVVARLGVGNHVAIAAAKAALEAMVRSLTADHAAAGFRFNAIAPGLMATPMTARLRGSEAALQQIALQYPLGRFGQADDAAALAAFLLGDAANWIGGQTINLDGGFSATRPFVRA
jgi:NAD(P)-dependent dehydrogenase (short-subunit alcohol dehydrogenase family)